MKILVVEDDELIAETLSAILSTYRYAVEVVNDGLSAVEMLDAFEFDVVLLDILLPKLSGLEVCTQARAKGIQVPILMLTARDSSQDKAAGLDAGADDYLVKPFDPEELIARVRALLRRGRLTQDPTLNLGHLSLNPTSFEVTYKGDVLPLTPKEYSLLELFLRNPKRVYSCGMILEHVWTHEETPGEEAVRTHIKGLRQKLKAAGVGADFITTVYGIGYRLKPQNKITGTHTEQTYSVENNSLPNDANTDEIRSQIDKLWKSHQTTIIDQINLIKVAVQELEHRTLSQQSRETAIRNAHSLAGSMGTFGFPSGSKIARAIEMMLMADTQLKASDIEQLQQWIQDLRDIIDNKTSTHKESTEESILQVNALLLFDTDRALANELRIEAQQLGYTLETSSSLKNAITLIENILPRAIILNPDTGTSLDQTVHLLEELDTLDLNIPVLIHSNQTKNNLSETFSNINVAQYIQKPVSGSTLLQEIQKAIKQTLPTEAIILAVDDDPSTLSLLQILLEPWGMTVHPLNDPSQFWNSLELSQPDLIILDVEMPIFNGIELCKRLRNNKIWNSIPVLFLTVHGNEEIVNEIFRAGADDYIQKPLVGPELITRILNRLERNRLLSRLSSTQQRPQSLKLSPGKSDASKALQQNESMASQSSLPGLSADFDSELFSNTLIKILNIADDAIICIDHQQNIIFFNLGAEQIFGYSAQDILGQSLDTLIPERYIHSHRNHVKDFGSDKLEAKQMAERQEIYGRRKEGIEFPAEASIAKLGEGDSTIYTVILRDISHKKKEEQKRRDFISLVSHELRTPLTATLGSLEMLSRGIQSNEIHKTDKFLAIAMSSTEQLVHLVNSMLDIERIDIGTVELNWELCDLADIAQIAVDAMQPMAEKQGVIIEMMMHSVKAMVDRERIFQTLTNILSNAIRFSSKGQTVFMNLNVENNQALFEIRDLGQGISKEQIDHVFERFHQSNISKSDVHNGIGLSLATCQSIIKQHDGEIWVESEEGKGSRFFITLPLQKS